MGRSTNGRETQRRGTGAKSIIFIRARNMKNNDFSKISDILNGSVLNSGRFGQALEKSMSCGMLFSFWKNVVGKRFEKLAIPYDLKGTTLFVSVMSPTVLQELSFFKADIIQKYAPYAEGLSFKISDIRFDYKNWYSIKNTGKASEAFDTDMPDYYTDKDFETVNLNNSEEEEFLKLKETVANIDFLPETIKEKMYNNAVKQYKAQKLRKNFSENTGKNP